MTERQLTDDEITSGLRGSPWVREGDAIVLHVKLDNFTAAVAAVGDVAGLAQEHNHHPDILIHDWNHLKLTLSTHSAGGLTAADLALAARIDALALAPSGG